VGKSSSAKRKRRALALSQQEAARLAGISAFALRELDRLGLVKLEPGEGVERLGASPEQVAEGLRMVEEFLAEAEQAGPGRPEGSAAEDGHPAAFEVMCAVRDYLMDNPGAAYQGEKRSTYSEGFKAFVAALHAPGGAGHGMTQAQLSYATGVPVNTLAAWASERRGRQDKGPGGAPDK
jgi:transcriptional regulator with XRE-family HTH domain